MRIRPPGPRVLFVLLAFVAAGIQDSWRLWILAGLWGWWAGGAGVAIARDQFLRAWLSLGAALLVVAAVPLVVSDAATAEPETRRLYGDTKYLYGRADGQPLLVRGRADGPTGTVTALVTVGQGRLVGASFTHREPPWVGDRPTLDLAAAIAREGRLPAPDSGTLATPVSRSGLRAAELALKGVGSFNSFHDPLLSPLLEGATLPLRHEDDLPTLAPLPAALLLALAAALALARALSGRGAP